MASIVFERKAPPLPALLERTAVQSVQLDGADG